jgi:hypothetical protein
MDRETRAMFESFQGIVESQSEALRLIEEDARSTRAAAMILVGSLMRFMRVSGMLTPEHIAMIMDFAAEKTDGRARDLVMMVGEMINSEPDPQPPHLRVV